MRGALIVYFRGAEGSIPLWGIRVWHGTKCLPSCNAVCMSSTSRCEHIFFISAHFLLFFALRARYAPRHALGGSTAVQLAQPCHFWGLNLVELMLARANKIMHFAPNKHACAKVFDLQ